jgi:two-component system, OmpR family, sensor kinase
MKRRIQGLSETAQRSADAVPDGVFLVRVDRAQYRWHTAKPFYILRLSILEPHELAGRMISGRVYCTAKALWKFGWFLRDFLYTDRRLLAIVVLAGLLLAGFGGWFLARKSLAPVLAMSEQAHRIGAENLDQRLPVGNPRDELGKLANTFNNLLSRLSAAFSFQRQFMADASHELRTPVSVIRTATSVTLEKEQRSEEEYRGALVIIDEQVRRLTRIVEDMFRLARADAGCLTLRRQSFYLDELLAETARAARVLGASRKIGVRLDPLPECPCNGDEDLLRQMISNLLDNAVKFTPPGGNVTLNLDRRNGSYIISVSDTGPGIPTDAQARVFERFFRVEKTEAKATCLGGLGSGAGLGLSIAKSIAEAHGGSLNLEGSNANGTTFTINLPATSSRV